MQGSQAISSALKSVVAGKNLSFDEARNISNEILNGTASQLKVAALLAALRTKGETEDEVAGFAAGMRDMAVKINAEADVDVVGTGGDGLGTFNVSTAAALLIAGPVKVLKHGNRSVSSTSGAADFLEALGYNISLSPDGVEKALGASSFAFVFAQRFHPAMKAVAPVRKELGIMTIFNLLGPLTNPGRLKSQVIGVYSRNGMKLMAGSAARLGIRRAIIVHGEPGMDEVSICGRTYITFIEDGRVEELSFGVEDLGFTPERVESLMVEGPQDSVIRFKRALSGSDAPILKFMLANAGAALWASGITKDVKDGIEMAAQLVEGAQKRVDEIVKASWNAG